MGDRAGKILIKLIKVILIRGCRGQQKGVYMIIEKRQIGAQGKRTIYAVCADATETGDKPHEITRADTLELATIIMRYMRGDSLSEADKYRAREAIKAADAERG